MLTRHPRKHEKTHSRPWKCTEPSCKYHEYGWPTEKERDRHMNDKHSTSPNMYKCHFSPCPYESKRESNCKQHMEKAHGWKYVRSKNNGKAPKKPPAANTPPTPQTPGSNFFNPRTPDYSEGDVAVENHPVHGSAPSPYTNANNDTFGPYDPNIPWDDPTEMDDFASTGHTTTWGSESGLTNSPVAPSPFITNLPSSEEESLFGTDFDWANMNHDFTSFNAQLITPATSVYQPTLDAFSRNPSISMDQPMCGQGSSLSPCGQGDAMLYSPFSMHENDPASMDEGYVEFHQQGIEKPKYDFNLFETTNTSTLNTQDMFPDLTAIPAEWVRRQGSQMMVEELLPMED
jgi:uncharacterized C2H2 Zn-finger protein